MGSPISVLLLLTLLLPLQGRTAPAAPQTLSLAYRLIGEIPHRPDAFTQGFLWQEGTLVESTGRYGASTVARLNPRDGSVQDLLSLPPQLFGEGVAAGPGGELLVLTWLSRVVLRLRKSPLALEGELPLRHSTQGWGLTFWQEQFVASDGSSSLHFLHPQTLAPLSKRQVHHEGRALTRLNELEVVEGWIAANVWTDNRVYFIDPVSGRVGAVLNLSQLSRREQRDPESVLNGLAWDPEKKTLYVTGKLWSRIYLLKLENLPPLPS